MAVPYFPNEFPPGYYYLVAPTAAWAEFVDWVGWFYVMLVSNLMVWPLGYAFKKLPGVRDVL